MSQNEASLQEDGKLVAIQSHDTVKSNNSGVSQDEAEGSSGDQVDIPVSEDVTADNRGDEGILEGAIIHDTDEESNGSDDDEVCNNYFIMTF